MSERTREERAHRFADQLRDLAAREDRGALAALRRGLGREPGQAAEMYPPFYRALPPDTPSWDEKHYFLVAALFALHPDSGWPAAGRTGEETNLGASLARLSRATEGGGAERTVVALLNAHEDDLPNHLRRAVGRLKSAQIPIDWAQLLVDLPRWQWESRTVQRAWARAFWADQGSDSGNDDDVASEGEAPAEAGKETD